LPTIYNARAYAEGGGLMSYETSLALRLDFVALDLVTFSTIDRR